MSLFLVIGLAVGPLAYRAAYGQVDEAVGIVLVGCANITAGLVNAADSNLSARGYKAGDSFYFAGQDRKMALSLSHGAYSKVYSYDGVGLKTGYGPIYSGEGKDRKVVALMAQGDLSLDEFQIRGHDETARLASDFNRMTRSFRDILTEVRDSSHQVASASESFGTVRSAWSDSLTSADAAMADVKRLAEDAHAVAQRTRLSSSIADEAYEPA
ncbi:methyl-accepting chemotaxis protein [Saccharibacillus deserti]|uniref:methyl-accepting chemotaxis protein n=1 Tax=Saccharibacillus deserti TaxID=1634444 RepID=UPI001555483A|nr:methyl-accepting chemotaxis protein [Saccharibacillus deserti]